MRCRSSQEHPDQPCFCSACHLSSELFPRRQDGKIVLPDLPASGDSPPLRAESWPTMSQPSTQAPASTPAPFRLPAPLPLVPSPQAMPPITTERINRGHRPRARSNARAAGPGPPSTRLRSVLVGMGTDLTMTITSSDGPNGLPEFPSSSFGSSTSNIRPRSRSQSYLTTTTAVSNPYPMPIDSPYPRPSLDNRSRAPVSESTSLSPSTSTSTSAAINPLPTPPLKFCPPFVACDRIALSPDSDAAKEGVTMIPWSVRRRKQKYRSDFDSGTGQGKGKTMFRYYGPESDTNNNSGDSSGTKKR